MGILLIWSVIISLIVLIITVIVILYFWGKRLVHPEVNVNKENRKRPLFTGNNKWKVISYYKGEALDPAGCELELLDFIYGNENGYTKALVMQNDKKGPIVVFTKSEKFCHGYILFAQDDGLVFEKRKHKHRENDKAYEISYINPGDTEPKIASYIIIKDGTSIVITKTDNREETWRMDFTEEIVEYRRQIKTNDEPDRTLSNEDELSLNFLIKPLRPLAIAFYKWVNKLFNKFKGLRETALNQTNENTEEEEA